jgi:S-DNA-T family DNA segregation ATPase FtsK/SpoIIIE
MARPKSIRRTRNSRSKQNTSWLNSIMPDSLQAFIARRVLDIFALCLTLGGIFLCVALLTYSSADPSWNTAASDMEGGMQNWMGKSGASVSDLLLQTLGLGSLIFGVVSLIWGIRAFNRQPLAPLWLRSIAMMIAALGCSIAFSQIPSAGWLTHPYMGSATGSLILTKLAPLGQSAFSWMGPSFIIAIAGMIALSSALYAAAFSMAEIGYAVKKTWFSICYAALYAAYTAQGFFNWVRHHNDAESAPRPFEALKSLQRFTPPAMPRRAPKVSTEEDVQDLAPVIAAAPKPKAPLKSGGSIPVVTPQMSSPNANASAQQKFSLDGEDWVLPSINILEAAPEQPKGAQLDEAALRRNAELLQNVLADFNVEGEITSIHPGPVVTLYELEPAPGTKSAKVIGLADDIARSMSAVSVRVAVVPGRNVIGIELPNKNRQFVYMQEMVASRMYEKTTAGLPLILGKDIGGQPIIADLAKMPHLLVAGTTGSGKSVAVNTMILSLLYHHSPEKCRFIMIDPKMLELSVYEGIPHLLTPVVTEPGKAVVALKWTVNEMEERYRAMSKLGVRNMDGYNERMREALKKGETIMQKKQTGFDESGAAVYQDVPMDLAELPYIVVIVDEFADLMLVAGKDVEGAIQRLAQMARAAGIHLIMATQRPSVDVITGVIKANFPTRISFQVTSKIDSRTILGESGAEQLLGMGDMLYMAPGGRVTRVHGPFVSDGDVEKVVDDLKLKAAPKYIETITTGVGLEASEVMGAIFGDRNMGGNDAVDELYDQAVALVAREGKASTSFVQRYLQIGYNRAARIIEEMERQGVISPASATGKRDVLITDFSDA